MHQQRPLQVLARELIGMLADLAPQLLGGEQADGAGDVLDGAVAVMEPLADIGAVLKP